MTLNFSNILQKNRHSLKPRCLGRCKMLAEQRSRTPGAANDGKMMVDLRQIDRISAYYLWKSFRKYIHILKSSKIPINKYIEHEMNNLSSWFKNWKGSHPFQVVQKGSGLRPVSSEVRTRAGTRIGLFPLNPYSHHKTGTFWVGCTCPHRDGATISCAAHIAKPLCLERWEILLDYVWSTTPYTEKPKNLGLFPNSDMEMIRRISLSLP